MTLLFSFHFTAEKLTVQEAYVDILAFIQAETPGRTAYCTDSTSVFYTRIESFRRHFVCPVFYAKNILWHTVENKIFAFLILNYSRRMVYQTLQA